MPDTIETIITAKDETKAALNSATDNLKKYENAHNNAMKKGAKHRTVTRQLRAQFGQLGYQIQDVIATVYDGSFHEVDSSEAAFKIAGSMAFKEAFRQARPVILEPIMAVEVVTPEQYMGDVIGDLNSKRGQVSEMTDRVGVKVIHATVPLSEMFGYATSLRGMTQGRASYNMEFDKYSEVPKNIAEEIMKKE